MPTTGILTGVRTRINDTDFSQVTYEYTDGWGNRTGVKNLQHLRHPHHRAHQHSHHADHRF